MDNRPIGVFDSGVGGLTTVRELRRILPQEEIIYFGDTARVPYGSRSSTTIRKYAKQAIAYLASFRVKAIVAACGTVSCNFSPADFSQLGLSIPYFTVLEPAVREALQATHTQQIALMATTASVGSGAYQTLLAKGNREILTTAVACPLLVALAETGLTDKQHPVTHATLEMYLAPIRTAEVDTLILGCTHFPLFAEAISALLGPSVTLIDVGAAAARALKTELQKRNLAKESGTGNVSYFVTDTAERFADVAQYFLSEDISGDVSTVDLEIIDTNDTVLT